MRIVGGKWRGRRLLGPQSRSVRPTADRMRQALFDMLMHASWGGRSVVDGANVMDVFAGTGALGLEALSRGAATCCFVENDPGALVALRANVSACNLAPQVARIIVDDATRGIRTGGDGVNLVFLDPPYGRGLVPLALAAQAAWFAPDALIVVETSRDDDWRPGTNAVLAERQHGAARMIIFRNQ
jgi:16S rRNA (guanine966-N2)-methyltransferase